MLPYKLLVCKIRQIFCILKALRWFILFFPGILSAQWSFDFENNYPEQWEQSPANRWELSSESPLNGLFSLHHSYDNPDSGEDYAFVNMNHLILDSSLNFSFRIRHAYNPSSGNNWQIYLVSRQADKLDYAIIFGVNFLGSDDLMKLWQVVDGEVAEIFNTGVDYENAIGRSSAPWFNISRNPTGLWIVGIEMTGESSQVSRIGEGHEISEPDGKYYGVRYKYSPAQDRKLWLDDIIAEGSFYEDSDPPKLEYADITGQSSLVLLFNENISVDSGTYFQWNGSYPDSIISNGRKIHLFFPEKFPNREEQKLNISGVLDLEGNRMSEVITGFVQNLFEFGEIVINEIMSDPVPEVYLPSCEYIELLNLTDYKLDITGWTLMVNSKRYPIGQGEVLPNDYLLITSEEQDCLYEGSRLSQVFTSSASLSNSGAVLKLFDQYQRLIHQAEYKDMSYYNQLKGDGGWSLERLNPELSCGGLKNWNPSRDVSGGTPGRKNSVHSMQKDYTPPEFTYMGIGDTNTIFIHFSESVYLTEEMDAEFLIKNLDKASPVFHTTPLVSDVIECSIQEPIQSEINYSIDVGEITDCEGNTMKDAELEFSLPQHPKTNTILINEIMYDAFIGEQEYLEFYNVSKRYIDLKDLKYGVCSEGNSMTTFNWMSEDSHLIGPGGLIVITQDETAIRETWELDYDVDIIESDSWKTLPNGAGRICLVNRSDSIMENFSYNDSMHHDLLVNPSGVSLERISLNPGTSNWTSASSSVNYGTPGTMNSQYIPELAEQLEIVVIPQVFSPDLDGYEDICEIIVKIASNESVINIYVTDLTGFEFIKLIENGISGSGNRFFWDGHDENGHLVLPGLYVIHIRISEKQGEKVIRKSCAVTYR